eukprot:766390-Hanusia_phi.AAC.3
MQPIGQMPLPSFFLDQHTQNINTFTKEENEYMTYEEENEYMTYEEEKEYMIYEEEGHGFQTL